MNQLRIYIDFVGSEENLDIKKLVERIKERLRSLKTKVEVILFSDLEFENEMDWEAYTYKAIEDADLVVPILTSDYLSFVTNKIAAKFDLITEDNSKYLFPIYFKNSEWGGYSWVVKSKIFPSNNIPLSELPESEYERVLNELIKTISNIAARHNDSVQANFNYIEIPKLSESKIVFISHDHDDGDFAELLKLKLEKEGLTGWIDSERLKIGQDWREEIDTGISNSLAVIAIMTPEARKSEYVTYEWAFAWGKGRKIFPIMLKQTQLHPRLESLQYLDFTNRTTRPWDKLINSIKELSSPSL